MIFVKRFVSESNKNSLAYLSISAAHRLTGEKRAFCDGCFTGNYPLEPPKQDIRGDYQK